MRGNMTVAQLIEILEGMDEEAEVRLAIQPNYPFEHGIGEVVEVDGKVYIAEKSQIGYLPAEVSADLGWTR